LIRVRLISTTGNIDEETKDFNNATEVLAYIDGLISKHKYQLIIDKPLRYHKTDQEKTMFKKAHGYDYVIEVYDGLRE
jgi:hypothetical protein